MGQSARHGAWQAGDSYDAYMGRWSRQIASHFLDLLALQDALDWVEIGCGTGALTAAIIRRCNPASVIALDLSEGFTAAARKTVVDERVDFRIGDAESLASFPSESCDVAVSALVLNFVPDPPGALQEMKRIVRTDGTVAFYVWDYPGGGVEFMRSFWTVAVSLDPGARDLTEDRRFPFCTRDGLVALAGQAGLEIPKATAIEVPSVFSDFDDYWRPFTLGAGPAPGYCASLSNNARQRLKDSLYEGLPRQDDGSIALKTRAWAITARVTRRSY